MSKNEDDIKVKAEDLVMDLVYEGRKTIRRIVPEATETEHTTIVTLRLPSEDGDGYHRATMMGGQLSLSDPGQHEFNIIRALMKSEKLVQMMKLLIGVQDTLKKLENEEDGEKFIDDLMKQLKDREGS